MHDLATRRNALSVLWLSVALNIAFADILGLYTPGVLREVMDGVIEGVALSERLLLVAAIFIEVPVAMIVAVQMMPERAWRSVNTAAIIVTSLFVLGGGSLKPHYVFFAACEILALLAVGWLVWKGPGAEPDSR